MRRAWRDFWAAFWLAFEAARNRAPRCTPNPAPAADVPREIVWPDSRIVCTLLIDCELCGESFVQTTEGWLLDHAGQHLVCPICTLPTPQVICYEARA